MNPKIYPDGPLGLREIRLIRLLPGKWTDPIDCKLDRAECNTAEYTALSYVWGSTTNKPSIRFAGRNWEVTRNLESALRHLRHHYKEGLTLWVDALCINQMDDRERTHQVGLMGEIYRKCQNVIVYLGDQLGDKKLPEEPLPVLNLGQHTPRELEKWQESRAKYLESRGEIESYQDHGMFEFFLLIQELCKDVHLNETSVFQDLAKEELEGHNKFTCAEEQNQASEVSMRLVNDENSWWNRIWVVQEIAFASQIDVTFGSISAPWEMFVGGTSNFIRHGMECCSSQKISRNHVHVPGKFGHNIVGLDELQAFQNPQRKDNHRYTYLSSKRNKTLLGLLRKFRARKATDPRDKVYALLGLAPKPRDRPPLVADYSLGEIDVFCQATLECILETNSLAVFNTELGRMTRTDLPSWVPDWTSPRALTYIVRAEAVDLYNAYPQPEAFKIADTLQGQNVLSLEGFHFNNVLTVRKVMQQDDCKSILEDWWSCLYFRQGRLDPEQDWELTRAFWKLICAEVIAESSPTNIRRMVKSDDIAFALWSLLAKQSPYGHLDFFPDFELFLERFPPNADDYPLKETIPMITNSIMEASLERRLIVSENYIGLAPAATQAGDALFFLRGGRSPFVLRPLGQNKYEIIGDCYIQGLMDDGVEKHRLSHDSEMELVRIELH